MKYLKYENVIFKKNIGNKSIIRTNSNSIMITVKNYKTHKFNVACKLTKIMNKSKSDNVQNAIFHDLFEIKFIKFWYKNSFYLFKNI